MCIQNTATVTSMHYKLKHWMLLIIQDGQNAQQTVAQRSIANVQQSSSWVGDSVSSTHLMVCG